MLLIEAAELLGLSPATLRKQVANGKLAARKLGRDWHVTRPEVERYRAESLGRIGRGRAHGRDDEGAHRKSSP